MVLKQVVGHSNNRNSYCYLELIPLTEVKGIGKARGIKNKIMNFILNIFTVARALWNYGFRTVRAISQASPEDIAKALGNSIPPNKAPLPYAIVLKYFLLTFKYSVARKLINSANDLLQSKAEEMREAAAKMLSDMNNL